MINVVLQVAEEECGTALTSEMMEEPYFVDFLRDAPEPTGKLHPTFWSSQFADEYGSYNCKSSISVVAMLPFKFIIIIMRIILFALLLY